MSRRHPLHLSRRESQIMDIVYHRGSATAAEGHEALPDRPSYSAVRALLAILERKGHLRHRREGRKYMYRPTRRPEQASRSALRRCLETFFEGSAEKTIAALLDLSGSNLTEEDYDRLSRLIDQARKGGR